MGFDRTETLHSFTAIQAELRKLPRARGTGAISTGDHSAARPVPAGARPSVPGIVFGCRLLHWSPDLENFRADVLLEGRPGSFQVYFPLNRRTGSRPHVFFEKLHKTKYAAPGDPGPAAERQFGITYADVRPKPEIKAHLDAFKQCATQAGALVASVREQLAAVVPAASLATRQDLHRWIFTVYDIAWRRPSDSPLSATRYIPVQGLNESLGTDEWILYDLDHIRSTPWADVERRLDKNRWGSYAHLREPYASWGVELPQYFASRRDDLVQASDWAVDWLVRQLEVR